MSTLKTYIKGQPSRPMREWADDIGISRSYLIALVEGERTPSISVAKKIERATSGNVSVRDWPNIRAVLDAANHGAAQ